MLSCFALLACAAACQQPPQQPEDVLEAFLTDLQFGRAEQALGHLDRKTRDDLRARWNELEAARNPKTPPAEPTASDLLYRVLDLSLLRAPESVAVVSPPGDRVTLRVSVEGGRSAEVSLVKEEDRWKVDLRDVLRPGLSPAAAEPSERTGSEGRTAPSR